MTTQASRESHQILQIFRGISGFSSLLWNIPFSSPALDLMCWWSTAGTLGMLELEELNLSPGYFFATCVILVSSFCSLNLDFFFFSLEKMDHDPYLLYGVVVRLQCGNLHKRFRNSSGAIAVRDYQIAEKPWVPPFWILSSGYHVCDYLLIFV